MKSIMLSPSAWAFSILLTSTFPVMAQTNLVTNGRFAVTGGNTSFQFGTYNNSTYRPLETLAGWTSTGYNFVFLPASTVATGSYGELSLYSGSSIASQTGGNFIAADSDFGTEAITQTIGNLTPGAIYAVSFAWAGAQQTGYTGASTEQWEVSLGGSEQSTKVINVASKGFSGWMNQTFNFVATSSSEVLSFLASAPTGAPPFALLANVSVTKVPEPASMTLLLTATVGLIGITRRPRKSRKPSSREA